MRGRKPELVAIEGGLKDVARRTAPPDWLSAEAKREWRRILPVLRERGILTEADMGSVENYCIAIGQVRDCQRTIAKEEMFVQSETSAPRAHPAFRLMHSAMAEARRLAAELGLTPVSRARPSVVKNPGGDDAADLDL